MKWALRIAVVVILVLIRQDRDEGGWRDAVRWDVTIEIVPAPSGSRMTITERGEIYNVVFRALSKFVFGYTGTMESCLAAAQKKLA
jgi:hypothetical protein